MHRNAGRAVRVAVFCILLFSLTCSATAAPRITSLLPGTGPVGEEVMIVGTNFGVNQTGSTVRFGTVRATTTGWSDTEIVVPVPVNAATGNVTVTVNGLTSNPLPFTVGPVVLQIASPTSGDIVNPGQVMSVSVTSPAKLSFSRVAVIGRDPIGASDIQTSVPAQFSLMIPANTAPNKYMLTAMGTTASGQNVVSHLVLIDVERPDLPVSIASTETTLFFDAPGDDFPITLLGKFADGSVLDVTHSSHVVYTTSNATCNVNTQGIVTAIAPGNAVVTATYTLNGQSVRGIINTEVPKPTQHVSPHN